VRRPALVAEVRLGLRRLAVALEALRAVTALRALTALRADALGACVALRAVVLRAAGFRLAGLRVRLVLDRVVLREVVVAVGMSRLLSIAGGEPGWCSCGGPPHSAAANTCL
jgi:hypothetical protein